MAKIKIVHKSSASRTKAKSTKVGSKETEESEA